MTKSLVIFSFLLLLLSACSKCYNCDQYCAYCVAKANGDIAYKFCSTRSNNKAKVDSFFYSFPDSTFNCVRLQNQKQVCDSKNSVDDAISYYLKQDYYCVPSE